MTPNNRIASLGRLRVACVFAFATLLLIATLSAKAPVKLTEILVNRLAIVDNSPQKKELTRLEPNGDVVVGGSLKVRDLDLEKGIARVWLYCDTRGFLNNAGNVVMLKHHVSNVQRIGPGRYRVTFQGTFGGVPGAAAVPGAYAAFVSSTGAGTVPLSRNTPNEIDVLCEDGREFWLVLFGDFTPTP